MPDLGIVSVLVQQKAHHRLAYAEHDERRQQGREREHQVRRAVLLRCEYMGIERHKDEIDRLRRNL